MYIYIYIPIFSIFFHIFPYHSTLRPLPRSLGTPHPWPSTGPAAPCALHAAGRPASGAASTRRGGVRSHGIIQSAIQNEVIEWMAFWMIPTSIYCYS